MKNKGRLLVVDDDSVTCDLLREVLENEGFTVLTATGGEEALELCKEGKFDLVISDIRMVEMTGIDLLKKLKETMPEIPVILITAFGSIDTALAAIKSGAADYISKPFKLEEIKSVVNRNLAHAGAGGGIPQGGEGQGGKYDISSIIGRSRSMLEVYKTIARVAGTRSTVLVTGESGTGKELVARAIHNNSDRAAGRFIPINCSSIPETLLESELFGHQKGSFTGAMATRKGIFEEADGGTCFLDEVGDMSLPMQSKLLRFLQDQEVRKVGGSEITKVDVRIIAATNRDLDKMVKENSFREDLFYRLKVVCIAMPPLRERREDIQMLVEFFINRFNERGSRKITSIVPEAMEILKAHDWPGNVRELEHVVERLVTMSSRSFIMAEDVREIIGAAKEKPGEIRAKEKSGNSHQTLEEVEKAHIEKVLGDLDWNRKKASEVLGIERKTLYRKIEYYGIKKQGEDES